MGHTTSVSAVLAAGKNTLAKTAAVRKLKVGKTRRRCSKNLRSGFDIFRQRKASSGHFASDLSGW